MRTLEKYKIKKPSGLHTQIVERAEKRKKYVNRKKNLSRWRQGRAVRLQMVKRRAIHHIVEGLSKVKRRKSCTHADE